MLGYSVDCVDFVLFEFGVHLIVLIVCCVCLCMLVGVLCAGLLGVMVISPRVRDNVF